MVESEERYEQLKSSVQELRSHIRNKPRGTNLINHKQQPSASFQLLQLQFSILDQARHEELMKLQSRLGEKSKQIELWRTKCDRKIQKSEDNYYSLKEHFRKMESHVYERVSLAEQEFLNQQGKMRNKYKELEVEHAQREHDLITSYESTIASLERQNNEKEMAKKVFEEQLKRMMDENANLRERIMLLELNNKSTKEKFRCLYQEQEKKWISKIQGVMETQEGELESLKSAIAKERQNFEEEKVKMNSEYHEYKAQKVREISCLEQHIRSALESKDTKILQLQQNLDKLQHLFQEIS